VCEHISKGERELDVLFHAHEIQNPDKGEALIEVGRTVHAVYRLQWGWPTECAAWRVAARSRKSIFQTT
jgi:hypothetical protein